MEDQVLGFQICRRLNRYGSLLHVFGQNVYDRTCIKASWSSYGEGKFLVKHKVTVCDSSTYVLFRVYHDFFASVRMVVRPVEYDIGFNLFNSVRFYCSITSVCYFSFNFNFTIITK